MTLTVEFTAPGFSWLPWAHVLWKDDKAFSFGWGPLQFHLTNFSPIAAAHYWRTVCQGLVHDDDCIMDKLDHLTVGYTNATTVKSRVREVMEES